MRWQTPSSWIGVSSVSSSHHQVQEVVLLGPTDRVGLVHRGHRDDVGQRVHRLAQQRSAVAEVGPERQERPRTLTRSAASASRADPRGWRVHAGTGGRSLRTASSTASIRASSASTASASATASRSSSCGRGRATTSSHGVADRAVVDGVGQRVGLAGRGQRRPPGRGRARAAGHGCAPRAAPRRCPTRRSPRSSIRSALDGHRDRSVRRRPAGRPRRRAVDRPHRSGGR